MALNFHHMVLLEKFDHGWFEFKRTGVKYAHDGIYGLMRHVPLSQNGFFAAVQSGSFNHGLVYDGSDYRTPYQVTCTVDGTIHLLHRFQLPEDFGAFLPNAIKLWASRSGAVTAIAATLRRPSADATISAQSISPSTTSTRELKQLSPGTAYSRNAWLTLQLIVTCVAGVSVEFSDLSISYRSANGNVP